MKGHNPEAALSPRGVGGVHVQDTERLCGWAGPVAVKVKVLPLQAAPEMVTGLPADTVPPGGLKVVPLMPPDTDQFTLGSPGEPRDMVAVQVQP